MKHPACLILCLCALLILSLPVWAAADTEQEVYLNEAGIKLLMPGPHAYTAYELSDELRELDLKTWSQQQYLRALLKNSDLDKDLREVLTPYQMDGVADASSFFVFSEPEEGYALRFRVIGSFNDVNILMRKTKLHEESKLDAPAALEELAFVAFVQPDEMKNIQAFTKPDPTTGIQRRFLRYTISRDYGYTTEFLCFVSQGYLIEIRYEHYDNSYQDVNIREFNNIAKSVSSYTAYSTWTFNDSANDLTMELPADWQLHLYRNKSSYGASFTRAAAMPAAAETVASPAEKTAAPEETGEQAAEAEASAEEIVFAYTTSSLWSNVFSRAQRTRAYYQGWYEDRSTEAFTFEATEFYRAKYPTSLNAPMSSDYHMNNNYRSAEDYARVLNVDPDQFTNLYVSNNSGNFNLYYLLETTLDGHDAVLMFRISHGTLYTFCYQGHTTDEEFSKVKRVLSSINYGRYTNYENEKPDETN